jgi:hypothetical protein
MELSKIREHARLLLEYIRWLERTGGSDMVQFNEINDVASALKWLKSLTEKTPLEKLQEELKKVDLEEQVKKAIEKIREQGPIPYSPPPPPVQPNPSPWQPYDPWIVPVTPTAPWPWDPYVDKYPPQEPLIWYCSDYKAD